MRALELGLAVFWLVLGLAIASEATKLGLYGMFGPDRGFFPFLAGVLMSLAALGLLVSKGAWVPADRPFWEDRTAAFRVGVIVVSLGAIILALPHLGFLLSGILLAPLMIRLAGGVTWLFATLIGICATVAIHVLFVVLLNQSLPIGPLRGLL